MSQNEGWSTQSELPEQLNSAGLWKTEYGVCPVVEGSLSPQGGSYTVNTHIPSRKIQQHGFKKKQKWKICAMIRGLVSCNIM